MLQEASEDGDYPVVISARHSLASFENDDAYKEVREVLKVDDLVQYLGDHDSLYSLVEQIEDDLNDEATIGVPRVAPNMDNVFGKLIDFNEEFMDEVAPQLAPFDINFTRDVSTVARTSGGRLVLKVEPVIPVEKS